MKKRLILILLGLLLIIVLGIGIFYVIGQWNQERVVGDLWKHTKIYKNDEFGFSFKYPDKWYLEGVPKSRRGTLLFGVTNFNPNKLLNISEKEMLGIDGHVIKDLSGTPKNSYKRMIALVKHNVFKEILHVRTLKAKNVNVYVIQGKTLTLGDKNKIYEVGVMFLVTKKANYLIYFFPFFVPNEIDYIRFLESITTLK